MTDRILKTVTTIQVERTERERKMGISSESSRRLREQYPDATVRLVSAPADGLIFEVTDIRDTRMLPDERVTLLVTSRKENV